MDYCAHNHREGSNKHCFCPFVCLSVVYIANNSRNQRPSMPKFGMKVPHLSCDLHTSFKVRKRSGLQVGRSYHVGRTRQPHCLFCQQLICCCCKAIFLCLFLFCNLRYVSLNFVLVSHCPIQISRT